MSDISPNNPVADSGPLRTDQFRRFLADCPSQCPACNHQLGGQDVPKCAKCHVPLMLALRGRPLAAGRWLSPFVPLLMGGGVGLFFSGMFLAQRSPPRITDPKVFPLLAETLGLPLAFAVFRMRKRINRLSSPFQTCLFALACLLVAGPIAYLFAR